MKHAIFYIIWMFCAFSPYTHSQELTEPEEGGHQVISAENLNFDVLRNGRKIGEHSIEVTPEASGFRVNVAIDLRVGLGPIPFYRYRHRNEEIWENGRLVKITTATNDNGKNLAVSSEFRNDTLTVTGPSGSLKIPASMLTSTYWMKGFVANNQMLDTQTGMIATYSVTAPVIDSAYNAERFSISGDLEVDVFYRNDRFVRLEFDNDGSLVEYILKPTGT